MNIHEIIGKKLHSEASVEELDFIENWLEKDTFNKKRYQEYDSIWRKYESLRPDIQVATPSWQLLITKKSRDRSLSWRKWMAVAASIFIVGFIYAYAHIFSGETYQASSGQISNFVLEDGSSIWLNKNSKLRYIQKNEMRLVELEGEAYFEVSKDSTRPFIISTGDLKTEVIGTSFNVFESGDQTIVTVASGKVKVYDSFNQEVSLMKGTSATYDFDTKKIVKEIFVDLNATAWKTGLLTFKDTPLLEVVRDLEKHYDIPLDIINPNPLSRLTATFDHQTLDEVLSLIQVITDIKIQEKDPT